MRLENIIRWRGLRTQSSPPAVLVGPMARLSTMGARTRSRFFVHRPRLSLFWRPLRPHSEIIGHTSHFVLHAHNTKPSLLERDVTVITSTSLCALPRIDPPVAFGVETFAFDFHFAPVSLSLTNTVLICATFTPAALSSGCSTHQSTLSPLLS